MITVERELIQEAMATDIYLCLSSDKFEKSELEADLDAAVMAIREFEQKYSRFIDLNELAWLNESTQITVSPELFEILSVAKDYHKKTGGLFDPAILPALLSEGYSVSKTQGFHQTDKEIPQNTTHHYSEVGLNNFHVSKPLDLKIDLGGIGKGFLADKLVKRFEEKYQNFCIDLGGDMYLAGKDIANNYPYWAIEIAGKAKTPTLLLSNVAVATSGISSRKWTKKDLIKNHLINPKTGLSVENELESVTVVAKTVTEADIMAKTMLLQGPACYNNGIPAVLVTKNGKVLVTKEMEAYVWHA